MPVDEEENTLTPSLKDESTTVLPDEVNEVDYEEEDEPVQPDDDDMETAEVIVFRPLFSYRQVQAARRRKAQRNQQRRYSPVYYW